MKNLFKTSILGKVEQSRAETTLINPTPIFSEVIILLYCKAVLAGKIKDSSVWRYPKNENTKTREKAQYRKEKYVETKTMMSL